MRTSSAANVGDGKDSGRRQREAIEAFARHSGHVVVSGSTTPLSVARPDRHGPRFRALLDRIVSNGVGTVVVEDPAALPVR